MIERRLRNVVVSSFGASLRKEKELVKISVPGEDGEALNYRVSPRKVEQIIVTGEASVSSGVIRLCLDHDVDLVFVKHYPSFFARVVRGDQNFISDLWRKQITFGDDAKLRLSKEFVSCGVYNKIRMLQSFSYNRGLDLDVYISKLSGLRDSIAGVCDKKELFGLEGSAARVYWGGVKCFLPTCFGFKGRVKHPPLDPVNSLLSYGYSVLLSRVEYGLMLAGLNMFEGVFHMVYRGRSALGFDLMEEFRQPIVDRVVFSLVCGEVLGVEDFTMREDMCVIGEKAKREYLDRLYSRLEAEYTWLGEKRMFLDIIFLQAEKLADAVGKGSDYGGFLYR